jgi:hypothetical protein
MYIAQIRAKSGRLLFEGQPFEDREDSARYAFQRGPQSAKQCSTSGAYRDPSGNWRSNGMDIRWHRRDDVWRDPPAPCDMGLFSEDARQADLVDAVRRSK